MTSPIPIRQPKENALQRPWGTASLDASDVSKLVDMYCRSSGETCDSHKAETSQVTLRGRAGTRAALAAIVTDGPSTQSDRLPRMLVDSQRNATSDVWTHAIVSSCESTGTPDFMVAAVENFASLHTGKIASKLMRASAELPDLIGALAPRERDYVGFQGSDKSPHFHEFDCNGLSLMFSNAVVGQIRFDTGTAATLSSPQMFAKRAQVPTPRASSSVQHSGIVSSMRRPRAVSAGAGSNTLSRGGRNAVIGRKGTNIRLANSAGRPGTLVTLGQKRVQTSIDPILKSADNDGGNHARLSKLAEKFKRTRSDDPDFPSSGTDTNERNPQEPKKPRETLAEIVRNKSSRTRVVGSSEIDSGGIIAGPNTGDADAADDEMLKESNPRYLLEKRRRERALQKRKEQEEKDVRRASLRKKGLEKYGRKLKKQQPPGSGDGHDEATKHSMPGILLDESTSEVDQISFGADDETVELEPRSTTNNVNNVHDVQQQDPFALDVMPPYAGIDEAGPDGMPFSFEEMVGDEENSHQPNGSGMIDLAPLSDEDGLIADDIYENRSSPTLRNGSSRFAATALKLRIQERDHAAEKSNGHGRFNVDWERLADPSATRDFMSSHRGEYSRGRPNWRITSSPGTGDNDSRRFYSRDAGTARFANPLVRVPTALSRSIGSNDLPFAKSTPLGDPVVIDSDGETLETHAEPPDVAFDSSKLEEKESKSHSKLEAKQFDEEDKSGLDMEECIMNARREMENVMNSELHNRIPRGSDAWQMIEDFFEGQQYMLDDGGGRKELLMDERWDADRQKFVQRYFTMVQGQWEIRLV